MNILSGEKIQQLCDIYLGFDEDFRYNPVIKQQYSKQVNLNSLTKSFNNPYKIFCYTHLINTLSEKIHLFENDFILITHNSDFCIEKNNDVLKILSCIKLVKWFSQNILFNHEKLFFIPIGLANSQWKHGNIRFLNDLIKLDNLHYKIKKSYFNFNINTNVNKRQLCYNSLKNKLIWLPLVTPNENLIRLKEHEFCICPEGNGVDSHRLWECFYLKVVPVVLESDFTNILKSLNIPILVLNNWDDFDENNLNYHNYDFTYFEKLNENFLNI